MYRVTDVRELVQKAIATYGKLDCAFNNAGIDLTVKPLHEQSVEDFDKIMSINARGLFLCMKYEIQMLTPRRRRDREQFINEWSVALRGSLPICQQTRDGADAIGCPRLCQTGHSDQCCQSGSDATDLMARSADQMGI